MKEEIWKVSYKRQAETLEIFLREIKNTPTDWKKLKREIQDSTKKEIK
jgi:hypothetical protein